MAAEKARKTRAPDGNGIEHSNGFENFLRVEKTNIIIPFGASHQNGLFIVDAGAFKEAEAFDREGAVVLLDMQPEAPATGVTYVADACAVCGILLSGIVL
jgi:hypothetical protein